MDMELLGVDSPIFRFSAGSFFLGALSDKFSARLANARDQSSPRSRPSGRTPTHSTKKRSPSREEGDGPHCSLSSLISNLGQRISFNPLPTLLPYCSHRPSESSYLEDVDYSGYLKTGKLKMVCS